MSDDVRSNEDLTEAASSGLPWVTLGRVGTEILLLGSMVLLARLVPPAAVGMYALSAIVSELAISVPSEGIGSAIVQRRSIERAHLQGGLAASLLVGVLLSALTLVLAWVLVDPVFGRGTANLIVLAIPWFLIGSVLCLPLAVLRRRLAFRQLALLELANSSLRSLSSIFFAAALGFDAPALVLGGLVGATAMLVLALIFAPVPLPRWRPAAVRDLLPYGGPAALATFAWTGFRNGDYAIVGAKLGSAQAGFYWRGFQLAVEYQRKLTTVMSQMGFPVLARTSTVDDMFVLRHRMAQLLCVLLFPAMACLVLLAPVLIPWLFGPEWEPAVLPTQILTGAGAATVVIDQVGSVLQARGRSKALLGYGVAHFAVYIVAVLVGARWGLAGVSIASVSVHLVFLWVAYEVLVHDRAESALRIMWDDIAPAGVATLALVALALPAELALRELDAPALVHVGVVAAVGGVTYLTALRLAFGAAWADLATLLRRVLPARRVMATVRRVPLLAGRAS